MYVFVHTHILNYVYIYAIINYTQRCLSRGVAGVEQPDGVRHYKPSTNLESWSCGVMGVTSLAS